MISFSTVEIQDGKGEIYPSVWRISPSGRHEEKEEKKDHQQHCFWKREKLTKLSVKRVQPILKFWLRMSRNVCLDFDQFKFTIFSRRIIRLSDRPSTTFGEVKHVFCEEKKTSSSFATRAEKDPENFYGCPFFSDWVSQFQKGGYFWTKFDLSQRQQFIISPKKDFFVSFSFALINFSRFSALIC